MTSSKNLHLLTCCSMSIVRVEVRTRTTVHWKWGSKSCRREEAGDGGREDETRGGSSEAEDPTTYPSESGAAMAPSLWPNRGARNLAFSLSSRLGGTIAPARPQLRAPQRRVDNGGDGARECRADEQGHGSQELVWPAAEGLRPHGSSW